MPEVIGQEDFTRTHSQMLKDAYAVYGEGDNEGAQERLDRLNILHVQYPDFSQTAWGVSLTEIDAARAEKGQIPHIHPEVFIPKS